VNEDKPKMSAEQDSSESRDSSDVQIVHKFAGVTLEGALSV